MQAQMTDEDRRRLEERDLQEAIARQGNQHWFEPGERIESPWMEWPFGVSLNPQPKPPVCRVPANDPLLFHSLTWAKPIHPDFADAPLWDRRTGQKVQIVAPRKSHWQLRRLRKVGRS